MKKATLALIAALLVLMIHSSAWAQSGVLVDLHGSGFGHAVSESHAGATFWNPTHRPYLHYSGPYLNHPYLGWGGYRSHYQHNDPQWTYRQHSRQYYGGHYRSHNGRGYGRHQNGRHHYQGHHGQRNHR